MSNVSHEFKSPLSALKGYLSLLFKQQALLSARHREYISIMIQSVDRIERFINDMLDLTALETGLMQIEPEWVDVKTLFQDVAIRVKPSLASYRMTLTVQAPAHLCVWADPQRVTQILRLMLSNAVKYTSDGGKVTLWAKEGGQQTVLMGMTDTGIGIPRNKWERVFEKFEQIREDKHKARKTTGTGLGLAIVKQLVEAQGGRIWVQGSTNKGTSFTWTLPRTQKKGEKKPAPSTPSIRKAA